MDPKFFETLVCPQCKGGLSLIRGGQSLVCNRCRLHFPIRDGVPFMLVAEAEGGARGHGRGEEAETQDTAQHSVFRITEGPDTGLVFHLQQGTCRALGRTHTDPNRTAVFHVDLTLSLDEGTKSLVMSYITKQFAGGSLSSGISSDGGERLGTFHRAPDVVLSDTSLSRLHAMLFSDVAGAIGILDLVSKNGTYVNGEEVESRLLSIEDVIEIGETKIAFEG